MDKNFRGAIPNVTRHDRPIREKISDAFRLYDNEVGTLGEALKISKYYLADATSETQRNLLKQHIRNEWSNVSNQPFPEDSFSSSMPRQQSGKRTGKNPMGGKRVKK